MSKSEIPNLCDLCGHSHYTGETLKFMGKQIRRRICQAKKVGGQSLSITTTGYAQCPVFSAAGKLQKEEAV